jgi:hypothetical protein
MNIFFGTVFIILVFTGLVSIAYITLFFLLKPKGRKRKAVYVLPLDSSCENVVAEMHFALLKTELLGEGSRVKVVVADMGLNNIQRAVCEEYCGCHHGIQVKDIENITDVI